VVFALAGNDWVDGGEGDDQVTAGAGSDLVIGGWGSDTVYAGIDRVGSTTEAAEINTIYGDLAGPGRDDPASMPGWPPTTLT